MVEMSKAIFVLVPGAWHGPEIYLPVMDKLNEHGYSTITLALPSNGADPPHQTFDEDVKAIRNTLTRLIDMKMKEVVLVLHSYAGVPGAEATKDLSREERYAKGLEGGVARLVFISAFKTSEGFAPSDEGGAMPGCALLSATSSKSTDTTPVIAKLLTLILSISQKGIVTVNREDAKKVFYYDLPPDEQDKWASELTRQSLGVHSSKPTYAAWLHIRSTYLGGDQDKTISILRIMDGIDETLQRMEMRMVDGIEFRCRAGHCLMISQPQWLFEELRGVAERRPVESEWARAGELEG